MNTRAHHNSAQAIQWALKKKEMLQKAKGLQEQHRYGIMPPSSKKAEILKNPVPQSSKYSLEREEQSKQEEMDPEEELRRARASLKLLKRKMSAKKTKSEIIGQSNFNRAQTCEVGQERRASGKENTQEQRGSSFYRKTFKPKFDKPSRTTYGYALGMRQEDKNRRPEWQQEQEDQEQGQDYSSMSRFSSYADKPTKSTKPKAEMNDEQEPDDIVLRECEECGRKFNLQAYVKHHKVCRKVFLQKRKKFDITSRRTAEGALAELKGRRTKKVEKTKPKANKWKQQSESLRAAMRSIRGNNLGSSTDTFGTGAYAPMNDLTECEFCGRSFNDAAIERHKPICERNYKLKKMQSRQPKKKTVSRY